MSQATGYFTHKDCWRHEMGAGHPECPERLDAIEDRLLISGLDVALERREATPAAIADLEHAHGRMHLASQRGLSDQLRDDMAAGGPDHAQVDPDTSINAHSWDAILMAAGAAIAATAAVRAGAQATA
ncbi:MAG: histone deacetylase family protein, partial [Hydrogenophaga sp.]